MMLARAALTSWGDLGALVERSSVKVVSVEDMADSFVVVGKVLLVAGMGLGVLVLKCSARSSQSRRTS